MLNRLQRGAVKGDAVICRRTTFRAAVASLALFMAAGPLLGALHLAAVRHVACADDGELIDAAPQAPHQHVRGSNDAPALFAERDPAPPPASGQVHDHCAVVSQAHLRGREQSRKLFAVTVLDALAAVSVLDQTPRLSSLALYRLAPKASPPLS
jgi:hypothetical protein